MIEANTCIATMAHKPLATAAINRKWILRVPDTASDELNGKKFRDLMCVIKLALLLLGLSPLTQELDYFYMDNYISLTAKTKVTYQSHICPKRRL